MTRPRIAGILSGVAASVAAFLVVSRWHLVGTLAGAATVPVVYALVSHFVMEGCEGLGRRLRRGGGCGEGTPEGGEAPTGEQVAATGPENLGEEGAVRANTAHMLKVTVEAGTAGGAGGPVGQAGGAGLGGMEARRGPQRRGARHQWFLVGVASLALLMSAASVVIRVAGDEKVVRQTVVEKTVVLQPVSTTAQSAPTLALGSREGALESPTTSAQVGAGNTETTQSSGADEAQEGADSGADVTLSTTTTTAHEGGEMTPAASSTTTTGVPSTVARGAGRP